MLNTPMFSMDDVKPINKMISEKYKANKEYYDKKYAEVLQDEKETLDKMGDAFSLWLFLTIGKEIEEEKEAKLSDKFKSTFSSAIELETEELKELAQRIDDELCGRE